MTQTLAGAIAGPITLSDANATILSGAVVYWYHTYAGHAIVAPIGVTSTVSNSGTVLAAVGYGIDLGAGTFVNAKGGAVIATMGAVYNFPSGGPLTVANQGLIAGYVTGVVLNHAGLITNAAGAHIGGGSVGIRLVAAGTVNNAGTIASYTIGIQGTASDAVTNSAGGEIYGGSRGVSGVSVLRNAGLVTATGAGGIAVTATYAANTGTILGATAVVAPTLVNSGIVSGAQLGVVAATVTNAGQILGGPGGALRLSANGRLVLEPGFFMSGNVDGGSTATSVLELAGAGAGTYLGALGTTVVDFGAVSVDAGANWIFGSLDTIAPGQRLTVAGTLASGATISEGTNSVLVAGGRLTNTGVILATGTAVEVAGGYLGNTGTITTGGTLAVHLAGGATFNGGSGGSGFVVAAGAAIRADAGAPALVELPGNPARITGIVDGGNPIGGSVVSTLVISGPLATLAGLGSHYVDFGLVNLQSIATASGSNTVAPHQVVDAYRLITTGTFTNNGTLLGGSGGIYAEAGTLFNSGTIDGTRIGIVAVSGGGETVVNAGTIRGHGGDGIVLGAGTTLVNEAGGLVTADTSGFGAYAGTLASFAVQLTNGGVVTNTGTLAARYGVIGGGTLINAGTIFATAAGTAVSLQDSLTSSRLVVEPGAVFIGGIDGGQTATPFSATLEFGAGSGTLGGFGVSISHFGAITLDPGAHWLLAGNATGVAAQPVEGFAPGSTLELTGTVESYVTFSGGKLTLSGGTTLALPGAASVRVSSDSANTFITACFAGGTQIATARGLVAVESLAVGDLVLTASGRLSPIVWLGHRALDLSRHARPYDVMPVRIRAEAFAEKLPERDLVLSPDHAVLVEGALVPVRHLVNGSSIAQETRGSITYWHVELSRHDVILAEGLACETYLDTGNRSAFEGEAMLDLHPDFAQRWSRAIWAARGCAPALTDPATPALRARHTKFLARASMHPARFRRAAPAAKLGA